MPFTPESAFFGEKDGSWGKYEDPELISGTADSVSDWRVYTWLTIFVNKMWFLVPLYTLLPGAKSRWHTGSFPNYFLLKHAQIISVIISLPSSTLLTLASNLKNYSEILIILFACCVEDEVRVCVCLGDANGLSWDTKQWLSEMLSNYFLKIRAWVPVCFQNRFKEQNVALLFCPKRHFAMPSGICCSTDDISDLTKHLAVEKYFLVHLLMISHFQWEWQSFNIPKSHFGCLRWGQLISQRVLRLCINNAVPRHAEKHMKYTLLPFVWEFKA